MKKKFLLGAHISVAGGYHNAIERARSIGCTTLQIFTKSNRQWRAKPISAHEAELFKKAVAKSAIGPIIAHASYLINLASLKEAVRTHSIQALIDEIERCNTLGIPYLVVHPGSNGAIEKDEGLALIIEGLNKAIEATNHPHTCMILLETMAGQGGALCSTFEDIAHIRRYCNPKRIGVCVDTCHIFAAGYDLRSKKGYEAVWHTFDKTIGLSHLKTIHINDSKKDLGSRVDRHENIGAGYLGDESFVHLFNDKRFFDIPKILETPKVDLIQDLKNMRHIVELLNPHTRESLIIDVKEHAE